MGWFALQVANGPYGVLAVVQARSASALGLDASGLGTPASGRTPFFQQCPADPTGPSFLQRKPAGHVPPVPHTKPPFLTLFVL
jgi:hypothetical protein